MYSTKDFRPGLRVEIDGAPYVIIENQFVKPGKGQAFNRVRLKNLITGSVLDRTWKSGEMLPPANVSDDTMQFLYESAGTFHFMNVKSYEQVELSEEQVGDAKNYLTENLEVFISFWGHRPISVSPPNFVELQISKCDPGVRGDTVSGATKPATLSTGYTVAVPLFVEEGEWIRVDTRTGQYMDRVKK
jgi:elongation factor P